MTTTIYLLRHAHTTASPQYAPDFNWPLDEIGQTQARQLIPVLSDLGVEAIYSSPQIRAIETVTPFSVAAGIEIQAISGLAECGFNRTWQTDFLGLVRRHWSDFDYAMADCETHSACQRRFVKTLHRLCEAVTGGKLVCCTGGQAIGLVLHSIDPSFGYEGWSRIGVPDIYTLKACGDRIDWDRTYVSSGPKGTD
jgi:2,3-bisphosphoglycerate-dependent phosphoglycerate mutase